MIARCLLLFLFFQGGLGAQVRMKLADGFDFPVGNPDAEGYYKARGMRLRSPVHFGEDWNGTGGGDSDLHDPIYAVADGVVMFAADVKVGWGRVMLIRHAYRDPATGQVKFVDSQYGHLRKLLVKKGDMVKRGQKIGTMGNNRGMYAAHLHFEIRYNLTIGMWRESVAKTTANWAYPTKFIRKFRRLKKEWRPVMVPTGTYLEYRGHTGL
ncbi:MAG: M23 family metallopeptidase [Akkermansiaceae bacterium]